MINLSEAKRLAKLLEAAKPVCGPAFIAEQEASFYNATRNLLPFILTELELLRKVAEAFDEMQQNKLWPSARDEELGYSQGSLWAPFKRARIALTAWREGTK